MKFLPESIAADPDRLAGFHKEVRLARQVSYPNVCRVYDTGESGDGFRLVRTVIVAKLDRLTRSVRGHVGTTLGPVRPGVAEIVTFSRRKRRTYL